MAAGGNRWWVIYQSGDNAGTAIDPVVPSSAKIVSVPPGSPPDMAWEGNGTYTGGSRQYASYQGWARFMGPFKSETAAKSARPPGGLAAIGEILAAGIAGGAPGLGFSIGNPLGGLSAIGGWLGAVAHWMGEIVTHLLDFAMWRSVLWIALGILLIWWGVVWWMRIPQRLAGVAGEAGRAVLK